MVYDPEPDYGWIPLSEGDVLRVTYLADGELVTCEEDVLIGDGDMPRVTYGVVTTPLGAGRQGAHVNWLLAHYDVGVSPSVDEYEVIAHAGEEWPDEVYAAIAKYQLLGGQDG